ncbi:hypothetical protein ACFOLJ_10700 [Rugamonas sp. CCM 8940]|uniref:hypothetical protein n=1 Tax=Rugamonas sp. CCM 8940 TaxID=2765359 RepID=UPI0018F70B11|nr:hypothetical protein [Rugamonas sp. CCM 8940]MBJ7309782.1 hypothetical protein [Rugamonas sp. CCM 8940]
MSLPISPDDCAFAVAVPLERGEFLRQYGLGRDGGFVHENVRVYGPHATGEQLWQVYRSQVDTLRSVLDEAQAAGVNVVRNATLGQFHALAARHRVVTLAAQWKSALFRPADLPAGRSAPTPAAPAAVPGISATQAQRLHALLVADEREQLLLCLNGILLEGNPRPEKSFQELGRTSRYQLTLYQRRQQIDACFPGVFGGGAAVEFSDGFHAVAAIVDGFAHNSHCQFDLSVCNSMLLADEIKRRCPASHVLCNEEVAYLSIRAAAYRQIIRRIKRRPGHYEEAVFWVNQRLRELR